jgi:hypothetical protein
VRSSLSAAKPPIMKKKEKNDENNAFFCFSFSFSALISAQKLKKDEVVGFWKLKESGSYENKIRVKKILITVF